MIMALGDLLLGIGICVLLLLYWTPSIVPHSNSNGQHLEEESGSKDKEHHANKNDATDNNARSSTIRGI
jgi:hypothetical protein